MLHVYALCYACHTNCKAREPMDMHCSFLTRDARNCTVTMNHL